MKENELQTLDKEEIIKLLLRQKKYNKFLLDAVRHFALNLLDEITKLRKTYEQDTIQPNNGSAD